MRYKIKLPICLFVFVLGCSAMLNSDGLRLYDLKDHALLQGREVLDRLDQARIVLVGEHHSNAFHHQAQLSVIEALHRSGRQVVIGLEMIRQTSQADLDRWVDGQIDEAQFEPVYLENWNFDWELYRLIFRYARSNRIPMVGLNIARQITRQVAYHGFDSLTPEQKGPLNDLTCTVSPEYRDYIRQAYGDHGHGHMNFDNFCQAQLLWDTAMAFNAVQYLNQNDEAVMVLLAGSGHAHKQGIPAQLKKFAPWPAVVLLPETPEIYDKSTLSVSDADYLVLR